MSPALLRQGDIEAADAPAAMHHALCSEETDLVVAFARSVITCPVEMLEMLASHLTELMFMPTDMPILVICNPLKLTYETY